jgi:hypothetical protein
VKIFDYRRVKNDVLDAKDLAVGGFRSEPGHAEVTMSVPRTTFSAHEKAT